LLWVCGLLQQLLLQSTLSRGTSYTIEKDI
jgi:hypothetical protein